MKRETSRGTIAGVVLGITLLLSACAPAAPLASEAAPLDPPEAVVESFYKGYLTYEGNQLVDGAYRTNPHLDPAFVQKVDQIIASFDKGGYDPFLCAQDIPAAIQVEGAEHAEDKATVIVHEIWNPDTEYALIHDVAVTLQIREGYWKITDIRCADAEPVAMTPEQVVDSFYSWYLGYIDRASGEMRNPMVDGAYRTIPLLTDRFIADIDAKLAASDDKGGYDPFLCAQDIPQAILVEGSTLSVSEAEVAVRSSFEGHRFTVILRQEEGQWAIDNILCGAPEVEPAAGSEAPAGGSAIVNEPYGFQLSIPEGWHYQEQPAILEGFPVPDGMKALRSIFFVEPEGWQGIAAPLSIDITEGTPEEFAALYPPANQEETFDSNGYAVTKTVEGSEGFQVIHYTIQDPKNAAIRIVFNDLLSGFPERLEGNEEVANQIPTILATFSFTE